MFKRPDGPRSESVSFTVDADTMRPVRDEVVEALDAALGARGGEVLHAIDPSRIVRFDAGGPAVWSVGMVRVAEPRPHWLFLTYGFSGTLSPVPDREGFTHEYSLAVPDTGHGPPIWGPALLRHLARYVLRSGAELRVGDNMPCHAPITRIPFSPETWDDVPGSTLDALVIATDPAMPTVETPAGTVEIRRVVGIHPDELGLIETWNCAGFIAEWSTEDPSLITDPDRGSVLGGALAARCRARADAEGGSVGALYAQCGWQITPDGGLEIHFPGGAQARQILAVLGARLRFGRNVVIHGPGGIRVAFVPEPPFGIQPEDGMLVIYGDPAGPELQQVLAAIRPDAPEGSVLRFG